jgi:alpha-tubulin suppressor-like RCC1 family protein
LGLGDFLNRPIPIIHPFFINKNVQKIANSAYHAMVLADDKLYGFGRNDYGQLVFLFYNKGDLSKF